MTLWEPSRYTKPLEGNEDLRYSGGHWTIEFVERFVRLKSGKPVRLAEYEKSILIRALETYPPTWPVERLRGKLRYRTFVLSMARRNHKTSLAGYMAFYGLLRHGRGSSVVLVAPDRDKAGVAYDYVYTAVNESPALAKRIKPTRSRGVTLRDGSGAIRVLTGDSDALQGHGILSGLFVLDEAHLMKADIYDAAQASMRSVQDGMVLVLSTAGDPDSLLYIDLLKQATEAINGGNERFGAIVLEGDPESAIDDVTSIKAANPAIDAGYFDLDVALHEARTTAPHMARRYLHNNQIESTSNPWVPYEDWAKCIGEGISERSGLIYSIDVSGGMAYASWSVSRRNAAGVIETAKIASLVSPDTETLERDAIALVNKNGRGVFVMDTYLLLDLAERLTKRGYEVERFRGPENVRAAENAYSLITEHRVSHNDDEVIKQQMRHAKTKNTTDGGFRLVRDRKTDEQIDAVMSMVYGVYVASVHQAKEPMLVAF